MALTVHIESEPNWTLDDTLYEIKSVVTLIQNRIPQVPPMDVVIHTSQIPNLNLTKGTICRSDRETTPITQRNHQMQWSTSG